MARSNKSKNKDRTKRSIRHREKGSDVKFDKMIGRCTRRDWVLVLRQTKSLEDR